jgi:hypothetical protein
VPATRLERAALLFKIANQFVSLFAGDSRAPVPDEAVKGTPNLVKSTTQKMLPLGRFESSSVRSFKEAFDGRFIPIVNCFPW